MLSLIRGGLQDFSISRTNFDWGIPLPWDPDHVTYVWFDALTNYITAAGYGSDEERFARLWPANIHMIGKDILRQHAIYWPAMLMAAGIEPPKQVWAHGYLTVGGKKMSKTNAHRASTRSSSSTGSASTPTAGTSCARSSSARTGRSRSSRWWTGTTPSSSNGIGNLASRVLAMLRSYFDGVVPEADGRGRGVRPPAGDRRGRTALRRGDARGAAYGRARRRLRRRRPRQPLHGRAVPLDPGEGRRRGGTSSARSSTPPPRPSARSRS